MRRSCGPLAGEVFQPEPRFESQRSVASIKTRLCDSRVTGQRWIAPSSATWTKRYVFRAVLSGPCSCHVREGQVPPRWRHGGPVVGSRRCSRMALTALRSMRKTSTPRRPPQRLHSSTSSRKARRSSSAQGSRKGGRARTAAFDPRTPTRWVRKLRGSGAGGSGAAAPASLAGARTPSAAAPTPGGRPGAGA